MQFLCKGTEDDYKMSNIGPYKLTPGDIHLRIYLMLIVAIIQIGIVNVDYETNSKIVML